MITSGASTFFQKQSLASQRKSKALYSNADNLIRYTGKHNRLVYDKQNRPRIVKAMVGDKGHPSSYYKKMGKGFAYSK